LIPIESSKMSYIERLCANKKCDKVGAHLCSGCGEEIYCSKECQKEHWAIHKEACKHATKPEEAKAARSLEGLSVKQLKNVLKAKASQFDDKKKNFILAEMDKHIKKGPLIKFASEYVKASEVEKLLSSPATREAKKQSEEKKKTKEALKGMFPTPTPEQLKQQAKMMRENPNLVRQSNAAFANMTDKQIEEYAEHLEKAADDPNAMREIEKMASLPSSQRDRIQQLQEGISGQRPMDDAWVDTLIDTVKTTPDLFKTMLKGQGKMMGGVSDEQIGAFIDLIASLPKWLLKTVFTALRFLGQSAKPLGQAYAFADKYTLGMIKYILIAIALYIVYYWALFCLFIIRTIYKFITGLIFGAKAGAAASTATTYAASSASNIMGTASGAAATAGAAEAVANAVNQAAQAVNDAVDEF
jgi:hypothetical protein